MLWTQEMLKMAKDYMKAIPEHPNQEACYLKNRPLWEMFRDLYGLPEYVIGVKFVDEKPVFTEADVVEALDRHFGFPRREDAETE